MSRASVTSDMSRVETLPLNEAVPLNIPVVVVRAGCVLGQLSAWLKAAALLNIPAVVDNASRFVHAMLPLKAEAPSNIDSIVVTSLISPQPDSDWLNAVAPANMFAMLVTLLGVQVSRG